VFKEYCGLQIKKTSSPTRKAALIGGGGPARREEDSGGKVPDPKARSLQRKGQAAEGKNRASKMGKFFT